MGLTGGLRKPSFARVPKTLVKPHFWSQIAVLPKRQRCTAPPADRPPEPLQIMPFTRFQLLGPHRGPTKAQFCKSTPNPSHAFWSLLILRGSGPSKIPKLHLWPSLNIEEQGDNQRTDKLYDRNLNAQIVQKVWCKLCSLSTKRSLPRRSGRSPLG